ncbi:MAG TPA: glycosyltransferase family 4 protein, partial [Solirubrobacteraceae bacterium]
MSRPLAIAHVTPYAWDSGHEVNVQIARTADELAARGHRVLIVAPSTSSADVRAGRAAIRKQQDLFSADGAPRVLAVGEAIPAPVGARRRAALPVDVARTVEQLLTDAAPDICHVHEPYAPSVASVALRHSRALNVGTFHAPIERVVSTQLARKVVDLVFGRLDARLASFHATADLLNRFFPADYQVLMPGADVAPGDRDGAPVRIAFVEEEERAALRVFLRALRRIDHFGDWQALVRSPRGQTATATLRHELRNRVLFLDDVSESDLLADADVCVLASDGVAPAPALALRGIPAGAVPLATSLAVYEEVTGEGEHGLLFAPRDVDTCAAQLQRLISDAALRERLRKSAEPLRRSLAWSRLAD